MHARRPWRLILLALAVIAWWADVPLATAATPAAAPAQAQPLITSPRATPAAPITVPGLPQRIERPASTEPALLRRGEAIFKGQAALRGSLYGQQTELPASALRCVNCHQAPGAAPLSGARPAIGSVLDARSLRTPATRRGGPPSYYTEESLCRLLREGIDPSQVLITATMPRYAMAPADCRALWAFLIQVQ